MISFRYHVTTLVAVLLALAAGVALGGGPLSEVGRPDPTPAAATDSATDDRGSDFADALAGQGAARMYGNRLEDVAVSIVSFPGASDATRSALTEQVQAAGGRVAATYAVQPGLVDTGEKTLVDTLGSQLMTQLPDGTVSADASTYQRIGELIGIATASTEPTGSKSLGDQSGTILSSLAGADLLSSTGKASGRASYVVLLLGEETDAEADPVYTGLVSGLAAHVAGIVVAEQPELVFCGVQSSDQANAATGSALARLVGYACAAVAVATEWDGGGVMCVTRELEGGLRHEINVPVPAVITMQAGANIPRYATMRMQKDAKTKPVVDVTPEAADLAPVGGDVGAIALPSVKRATILAGNPDDTAREVLNLVRKHIGGHS